MPKARKTARRRSAAKRIPKRPRSAGTPRDLVVITGLSGSGKASALKAFEDLGFYAVDNMPVSLMPPFAELVAHSRDIRRAALVVDVREGVSLEKFPSMLRDIRRTLPTTVLFLEASKAALLARYSETRRPHPLGREERVTRALQEERRLLQPIRNVADVVIDTTKFNVHELRAYI
jgi:RNase adapter protein RapZ